MRSEKELSAAVRSAMKERNLTRERLCRMLDMSSTMLDKLLCGDIDPSVHLQKQLVEVLGIDAKKMAGLEQRRDRRSPKRRTTRVRKAA